MKPYDEKSCGAVIFRRVDGQIHYLTIKYKTEPSYWGFAKGHVENGETELETAKREIYEEVGLTDLVFYDGFRAETMFDPKPGVTKLVVFFLAETGTEEVVFHFQEHDDYRWLTYDDVLKQLTYESDRDVIREADIFLKSTQ
ncbi:MAG: NUDIX domain-containing protein [Chloroflexota bacterium]